MTKGTLDLDYGARTEKARTQERRWEVSTVATAHLAECLNEQVARLDGFLHEVTPLPDGERCLVIWYRFV